MTNELNIAGIQATILWENPRGNFEKYSSMIDSLSLDIDLISLPKISF